MWPGRATAWGGVLRRCEVDWRLPTVEVAPLRGVRPASTTRRMGAMSSQKQLIRRGFITVITVGIAAAAAVGSSVQVGRVMAARRAPTALGTCTIDWTG